MSEHDDFEQAQLRIPPHSTEAEQAVIGALLQGGSWDKVGDLLTPKDLYRHEHRTIFEVLGAMSLAGKPTDVLTVHERLVEIGKSGEVGGIAYLGACANSIASAAQLRYYAGIVRDRSMHRTLIASLDEASARAWTGSMPATQLLDELSAKFLGLERGQARKMPRSMAEIVPERVDRISNLASGEQKSGWPTRFHTLDAMLNGGLRAGSVYVLAARPSVGKSALAAAIAVGFAEDGLPSLFLSQEMSDGEVVDRTLASLGEVAYGNLQTGLLNEFEWSQLSQATERAAQLPFYVDDQGSLTIGDIRAKARSVKGLKLLVLDYLQLSASRGEHSNRNGEIEEVSRGLKSLAKELGIAVLMLSQLNRKVEERPGKRPMLSDLRDSGSIEQDADVVMFLWPLKEFKADGFWAIGCDLPKNRQGKKGAFPLHFYGDYMRWTESKYRLEDLISKDRSASTGGGFD